MLGARGSAGGARALVHGDADVGVALAQAPVAKVLFTGSPAVGRVVARACVSREKEVTVELGGKDAMLVLADAHLRAGGRRRAVGRVRRRRTGARLGRAHVRRARGLTSASSRGWSPAHGRSPSAIPPIRARRSARWPPCAGRARARAGRRRGRAGRAAALRRPGQPAGLRCGAFYAPAVITGVTPEMRLMREPIDGPVLAVVPVDSVEEAIALANGGDYCLGASVWTADRYQGVRDRARAARRHGLAQRPSARPDRLARPVGRCRRRRPWPHARRRRGCARAPRRS